MYVQTTIKAELREALLKSAIADKENDQVKNLVTRFGVANFSLGVILLINEGKAAEALILLFRLHKEDVVTWFNLSSHLISKAGNHSELSMAAAILKASSKNSISESFVEIPGLYAISRRENNP